MQQQYTKIQKQKHKKHEKCKSKKTAAPCGRFPRATLQQQSRTGGRATVDKKKQNTIQLVSAFEVQKDPTDFYKQGRLIFATTFNDTKQLEALCLSWYSSHIATI